MKRQSSQMTSTTAEAEFKTIYHWLIKILNVTSSTHLLPFVDQVYQKYDRLKNNSSKGGGCGSVGRAVASDIRKQQFKSDLRQNFIMTIITVEKTKMNKKGPGMFHIVFAKKQILIFCFVFRF